MQALEPAVTEKVFTPQLLQAVAFVRYLPGAQIVHDEAEEALANKPAGHIEQVEAPAKENEPAGHIEAAEAPIEEEKEPAAHI